MLASPPKDDAAASSKNAAAPKFSVALLCLCAFRSDFRAQSSLDLQGGAIYRLAHSGALRRATLYPAELRAREACIAQVARSGNGACSRKE
jgi:hypothetical protein